MVIKAAQKKSHPELTLVPDGNLIEGKKLAK
jgi:hypothetical protein